MADPQPIVVERCVGDDWTISGIALTDAGAAADLTGSEVTGLVFARDCIDPVAVLSEGEADGLGDIVVAADRTTGVLTEAWISRIVTAAIKPDSRRDTGFPTRLCIVVTDSRGRARTWLTILFRALDRRVDPLIGVAS